MKTDDRRPLFRRSLAGVVLAAVLLALWGAATHGSLPSGSTEPAIASLTPESGPEGMVVTIGGSNFGPSIGAVQGTSGVSFNGVWATPSSWSDTEIRVAVPPGAATGPVVVTVSSQPSNGVEFTVTGTGGSGPAIGSVSPVLGPEGTVVTVRGANFGPTADMGGVSFNGVWAAASSWSDEEIRVPVPADAATGEVVVTANGQASNGVAFIVPDTGLGEPVIDSLSAVSGPEGMVVRIEGENFGSFLGTSQGTSGVSFNGVWASPTYWSETQIQVPVPAGAPSGLVTVAVGGEASNGLAFVVERPAPLIEAVDSSFGPEGATVEISGRNFGPAMEASQGWSGVSIDGLWGMPTYWSDREIHVSAPAGVSGGLIVVTSVGQESNGIPFTVARSKRMPRAVAASSVAPRAGPELKSLDPAGGSVGTPVKIKGKNLGDEQGGSTVTFNGTAVTNYVTWSNKKIDVTVPAGATTGDVVVTVGGVATAGIEFTVTAGTAPTIGSLDPDSGPEGTTVEITGTNFGASQGTSSVTFNGTPATPTNWSDTSITVAVPMGATTGNVVVTVDGTPSSGVSFTMAPAIGSLSPDAGPEGTTVEITGTSFGAMQGTSTVTFNGTGATPTSWSDTSITVTVPAGATTGSVVVTVGGTPSDGASFAVTPAISSLSPIAGPEGATVEITGTSFGAMQGTSSVTFNGTPVATYTSWSDTSITVMVPMGATTGDVVVTVGGEASNGVSFAVGTDPVISGLNPDSGPAGTTVEITGANFGASQGTSTVTFNGAGATPANWSDTSITVTVPTNATTGNVVVTVDGTASNGMTFTVKPVVGGLSRVSGPEGATVVITGTGFGPSQGTSTVTFNRAGATPTNWSDTSITVTVPAGAATGSVVVTVGGTVSDGVTFTVTPAIGSLSPIAGPEGATVVITGTSFGAMQGTSTVTFNGTGATPTSWSGTSITVTVPAGATTGPVVVTVAGQASNGVSFTVGTDPIVTSLSPALGQVDTSVVIGGVNFGASQGTGTVTFNGVAATATSWSDSSITVTVPASATTGPAVVTVAGVASNLVTFTVTGPPPVISKLKPDEGEVGESVKIKGEHFGTARGTSKVTFNGEPAISRKWGDDKITVNVPAGARTGPVVVTVEGQASNPVTFSVTGSSPSIISLDPTSGEVDTSVTITGVHFGATKGASTVTFNGVTVATYTSWSDTAITVPVPATAATGPVVVTVGGQVSNGVTFTVTVPAPSITGLNPTEGRVGASVAISGENFGASRGTSTVTFNGTPVATYTIWSDTSITVPVPATAATGPVVVMLGGQVSNGVEFTVDETLPGVTVTEATLDVAEGSTGTYQVKLNGQPGADVTITPASGDTDVATVSPPTLTFTPSDWSTFKTVTVSAVEDEDGSDETATITHTATSTDSDYNGISPIGSVVVSVDDDDPPGVTVTETALDVTEGETGTYQVKLDTKPSADVTVTPASGDTDVVTVSPPTLTFTPSNWSTFKTVTVSAEQDDDGSDATATITHTATSTDSDYDGIPIGSVVVSVDDDDPPGVTVTETALDVTEGETGTYQVKLDTKPSADVTVTPASGDTDVATVSPPLLTFTPSNWNTFKTVTVSAEQDEDLSNATATITHTATSADSDYDGISPVGSVEVSVEDDDDPAGVTVTETTLDVTEGATGTYQVKLGTKPSADVTITPASGDTDVATVSPPTLTFTPSNWNTFKTVTVSAVQDDDPSDEEATISHTATSADTDYAGISIGSVVVSVDDDDPVAVTVTEATLDVTEGATGTYQVKLGTKPSADVTITPASGDTDVATVSPPTLTFTPSNWNTFKTVTVSAVQDDDPSDEEATISHTATSADTDYTGISIGSVVVSVDDDDAVAVTVTEATLDVTEGATGTYQVKLDTKPSADVTVTPASGDTDVATVSPPTLTFTPSNWNTFKTVTVSAVQDDDGSDATATISHTATSTDTDYNGILVGSVVVTVDDANTLGVTVTEATLDITEGATGTYQVKLDTKPSANVTVTPASGDTDVATVSPPTLTFTPSNWNTFKTVTVSAVQDDDGSDATATISHTATSTDTDYNGILVGSVVVTVDDANTLGVTVTEATLDITEGATGTYQVKLDTKPSANVTVTPASGDTDVVTVSPPMLTFTPSNWSTFKTVTVSAVQDDDGSDEEATISHTATSTDTDYNGISPIGSVAVSVDDDDPLGVMVSPTSLTVNEGGTGTYQVKLKTKPTGSVTVSYSESSSKISVSPASRTFTTGNWNSYQSFTVTGLQDDDGSDETAPITNSASGADYGSVPDRTVTVTVRDDDPRRIVLDKTSLTVNEGGTGSFKAKLNTEPTAEVSVSCSVNSNGSGEISVSPSDRDFDDGDWNSYQSFTVEGLHDDDGADETATITCDAGGGDYGSVPDRTVTVTVRDDDPRGIVLDKTSLTVNEGGTGSFKAKLNTEPTAEVSVSCSVNSNGSGEISVSPSDRDFDDGDWNSYQSFTVEGLHDDDGADETATITCDAGGGDYGSVPDRTVTVTVRDDDPRRIVLDKTSLTVNEGGTGSFKAKLNTEPTAEVSVSCSVNSNGSGEISVSPSDRDFDDGDWNSYQSFTVEGLHDDDGADETATITCDAGGGDYGSVPDRTVTVTVRDDDPRGIVLDKTSLTVNEGGTGSFKAKLNTEPTAEVSVSCSVNSNGSGEISVSPSDRDFDDGDWNSYQSFTVEGLHDDDGADETATITCDAGGGDYGSVPDRTVTVTVRDDDPRGIVLDKTSLTVNEGGTGSFKAKLNTEPTAEVSVSCSVNSNGSGEISVSPSDRDFDDGDWNSYQSFTVEGLHDDDGADETATITCDAGGGDYGSVPDRTVTVTVRDDDPRGIVLDKTSLTVNEGGTGSFKAKLNTEPTAEVSVSCSVNSNGSGEISVSPSDRDFDDGDWNSYQSFTVEGLHDDDGADETATITCDAGGGDYGSVPDRTVTVTVRDDDPRRIVLDKTSLTVNEGGTGTFRAKLSTEPTGKVTVSCSVNNSDSGKISVSPGSGMFDANNWNFYQSFTVTGLQDDDARDETATIICSASGGDYGNVPDRTVTVMVDDDEMVGVIVDPTSLDINEGSTGTYRAKLKSKPSGSVTITRLETSSKISVSPARLTFTTSNWDSYQSFTVRGLEDDDACDEEATISHSASSTDDDYDGIPVPSVDVTVDDDEVAGIVVSSSSLSITEGNDGTYNVKLSSKPKHSVTISFSVSGSSTVSVPTSSRTFTTSNWNTNQAVTVRTAEDDSNYSNESATVTNTATSSDSQYSGKTKTVSVSVTDDDTPPPQISSIFPPLQPPDTLVTISGYNFGSFQGSVSFGGSSASINSWSNTSISCFIPIHASAGTVSVTVTTSDNKTSSGYSYTITGQSPLRGDCGDAEDCPEDKKPEEGGSEEGEGSGSEESEDPPSGGG